MWFIKAKDIFTISRKEIPVPLAEITQMRDPAQPKTFMQALMQAAPSEDEVYSEDLGNPIKEAILDCMELLTEQDRFVIDAIYWEQATYVELAKRLRSLHATCMEAYRSRRTKPKGVVTDEHHSERLHIKCQVNTGTAGYFRMKKEKNLNCLLRRLSTIPSMVLYLTLVCPMTCALI